MELQSKFSHSKSIIRIDTMKINQHIEREDDSLFVTSKWSRKQMQIVYYYCFRLKKEGQSESF